MSSTKCEGLTSLQYHFLRLLRLNISFLKGYVLMVFSVGRLQVLDSVVFVHVMVEDVFEKHFGLYFF